MSPPNNYNGSRRVDFSTGLSTIDSGVPEETHAPHWDSETDHLLSYFLGDPHGHALAQPSFQNFSTLPHSLSAEMNPPLGMTASYGPGSSRTSSNSTLTDADPPLQPRTPAMQFYHTSNSSSYSHSHPINYARQTAGNIATQPQQAHIQLVSSNSSSSLSSLAATLVSGGPVLHHQIHHHHHASTVSGGTQRMIFDHPSSTNSATNPASSDSPPTHREDSPISPVAMIGTAHENLMLPPPSRRMSNDRGQASGPAKAAATTQQHVTETHQVSTAQHQQLHSNGQMTVYPGISNKEAHLEWINQLNARAKAATQNPPPQNQSTAIGAPGTMVSNPHVPGQPLVAQHPGAMNLPAAPETHVFHAGTFPSAAAAAAAVAQTPLLYQAALNHKFHLAATSQGESEEKRARRLERNRESARKSRRRKKERLSALEAQVDRLHTQIEDERRNQVNAMCSTLKQVRSEEMNKLVDAFNSNTEQIFSDPALQQKLATVLRCSSGGSQIAQATVEFQYNTLKNVLLPRYQKFLLWVTLHDEGFFMAGKDEYTRKDGKQILRVSSGRVSSKQIGDELTNGWKTEGKTKVKPDSQELAERANPTSRALDAPRMWPLLCYELSISVDQEERFVQALKRLQQLEHLANYRSQLAAATKMTHSLTVAISAQCRVSSAREEKSLLEVLTPSQTIKFHEWIAVNQERCDRFIRLNRPAPEKCDPVFKDTSLIEFCKRLDDALRISRKDQMQEH